MSAVVCTYIYIHAKYRWHRLTASARSLSKGVLVPDDRQLRGLLGKRTRREKKTEKGKKNKGSAKRGRNYARSSRGDFLGSWNAEHRYVEQARRLEPSVKDRGGEERCLFSTVVFFFFFPLLQRSKNVLLESIRGEEYLSVCENFLSFHFSPFSAGNAD